MQSTASDRERDLTLSFLRMNRADREKVERMDRYYIPLAYNHGLRSAEIAQELGISEEWVLAILLYDE